MSTLALDENKERIPDLELIQQKFLLSLPEHSDNNELKTKLLDIITLKNMAPWYEAICDELGWNLDQALLTQLKTNNEEDFHNLDENIEEAETRGCVIDLKEAILAKAHYLLNIGDKDNAIKVLAQAYYRTMALGYKLDNVFTCIRTGFFFMDHDLIRRNLERAEELVEMGTDYDRQNRLSVYKGFYALFRRDFETAAENFLKTAPTFTCTELLDYTTFIRYTVFSTIYVLGRNELKKGVIENPDILEVLHQAPDAKNYVFSLYNCEYAEFFQNLARIEIIFRENFVLRAHYKFYVREMRIKAYVQFLISYKSLTFTHMAERFGVTPSFVEEELSKFISMGRLHGKIDKVSGTISVTRGVVEKRSELFRKVIRQGDLLLNRIHHISRILEY